MTLKELQRNAAQDKAQIEALKNAIFNKVKSNEVAKKAAMIMASWLEKDSAKKKSA